MKNAAKYLESTAGKAMKKCGSSEIRRRWEVYLPLAAPSATRAMPDTVRKFEGFENLTLNIQSAAAETSNFHRVIDDGWK